jgi:hypothetical protein
MRSLRSPWYRASVRRAASEHWLTTGSRGLRGMTGEPVELSDTEAATVLAALVETTGGRWPAHTARVARMLRRLGIDGNTEQMAAAITALVSDPHWPHRAREITSSASDW